MTLRSPRSIDQYLQQLRVELKGEDPALIQDALYDAEEYLRAEIAAHAGKSEADVLELIASTYGAPEEVAAAYRETEVKVKAAMKAPVPKVSASGAGRFFGIFLDPRAYTSLFFMLLSLATGIIYFTFVVTGLSLSAGFAVLVIGIPFFLVFIGVTRAISLGEGRLIEAMTGERMPRRPLHPGAAQGFWTRVGHMLKDRRTWSTLAYLLLMLPIGIVYFVTAVTGLSISLSFIFAPLAAWADHYAWWGQNIGMHVSSAWALHIWAIPLIMAAGLLLLALLMHVARGVGRLHAAFAKALLVN